MPLLFCINCGAKNEYQNSKPKTCRFCDASTDPLANFKPVVSPNPEAPGIAAKTSKSAACPTARRLDRWSTEGNVVGSREELGGSDDGDTFESIGIDQRAFAARVEGEVEKPMTVESLRASQGGGFSRPALSAEEEALKAEAMKEMLNPSRNRRA